MAILVDEALLQEFREKDRCEFCLRASRSGLDPHHIFARGLGGAWRLDHRLNLVALCRVCHTAVHQGKITREELIALVADREKLTPREVLAQLWKLRSGRNQ